MTRFSDATAAHTDGAPSADPSVRIIAPGEALAAELERLGKSHLLRIFPSIGNSTRDGHNLVYRGVATWESDVFMFVDGHLRR